MGGAGGAGAPRSAVVVGAGIVGLSTAWFLQEQGVEVTVVERDRIAAGASWGNAGRLSPGLAVPLNEPAVLRYGMRALLDPRAPLYVPATTDTELLRFLALFAAHCRPAAWDRALRGNLPLNRACLEAYDELADGGVAAPTNSAPITVLFASERAAARLLVELRHSADTGLPIEFSALTGEAARAAIPQASEKVRAAVRLDRQRYVDPGAFTHALADAVRRRGGTVVEGFEVTGLKQTRGSLSVHSTHGEVETADTVVAATGAWLGRQGRAWGIRVPLSAGRGYSFTVPLEEPVSGPVYLPEARVACTPYSGGLRVAGTMEFRRPDAPLDRARTDAIAASALPYLDGVDLSARSDEWVGPRPVTADGLPLIGATSVPGLYAAGGHGMWGLTHGPITGRLLARAIATGRTPAELRPFDPTR